MRYANEADVLAQLRMNASDDPEAVERVIRLENGLADTFDHKIGRSFGTAATAETRTIHVGPVAGDWFLFGWPVASWYTPFLGTTSHHLVLDVPIRSVTSITTGGTWDGSAWDDTTALTADDYLLANETEQGSYAIDHLSGTWGGLVHITGIWGDQAITAATVDDVPDDVREAMTFLTIHEYHQESASQAGLIGPDGMAVPARNPWGFERVKSAIDRWRLVEVLV